MKNKLFSIIMAIVILISSNCKIVMANQAKTPTGISIKEINRYVDEYMQEYIGNTTVGASVAVLMDNKVILNKAYGYADFENKIPLNTANQVYEWGSVTKLFTWVSVMQLVEANVLDLNEDIRNYLPNNFLTKLKYDKPITLLNLMNHTAGFEDYLIDLGFTSPDNVQSLAEGLKLAEPEQVYEPGSVTSYSNFGAALAGYIVALVSGMEFYEYVNKNILEPLEMTNTSIHPKVIDKPYILDNKAIGHIENGDKTFSNKSWTYVSIYPCGSINGTVADMIKFVSAFMPSENETSKLFKNNSTLKELLSTSYSAIEGLPGIAHGFIEATSDKSILYHPGNTIYFSSMVALKPDDRMAVIIVSNQKNENNIVHGLTKKLLFKDSIDISNTISTNYDSVETNATYVPSRYQHNGFLQILGYMRYLNLHEINNNELIISQLGQKIVFKKASNGIYTDNIGAIYASVKDNEVNKFWLDGMEFVPTPKFKTEPYIIISAVGLAISILYYFIINIINGIKGIISLIKKRPKKERVQNLITLLNLFGLLMVFNFISLMMRSLPWPVSSTIMLNIIFMYILSIIMVILIVLICKFYKSANLSGKFKKYFALSTFMGILFMTILFYWGMYSIN